MERNDPMNILIVDDKIANLISLEALLEDSGRNIVSASSGNEALVAIFKYEFALVLLDVQMPGMDGYETAELIRGDNETSHVPIIFVTANSQERQHVFKGYQSGAVDYLLKPIDPMILRNKVSVFCELFRQRQVITRQLQEMSEMTTSLSRVSQLAAIGEITAEIAHQINNPLAAAMGATRQLGTMRPNEFSQKWDLMYHLLSDSLERIRICIAELKQVYKTSKPMDTTLTELDIEAQVHGALSLLQQQAETRNISVDISQTLPKLNGDISQIRHAITNLLDNAILAAGEGGSVHIHASIENSRVLFTVDDDGPGVPDHLREKVFEPFFTTRETGSGLGLSMVRRNLEQHGATIKVEDSQFGGARFEIRFLLPSQEIVAETNA